MPVLGAVLTIASGPRTRARTLQSLAELPGLTTGPIQGHRLPVVLESDTRAQDKDRWKQLGQVAGVLHVELVSADFSDLNDDLEAPAPRTRRPAPSPETTSQP